MGKSADLLIDPVIDKADVVGFGTDFPVTDNMRAKRMWLDRTIAAAVDIAEYVNDEAWFQLVFDLREVAGDNVPHMRALAEKLMESDALREAAKGMVEWPAAELFGLDKQVDAFLGAIKRKRHEAVLSECWALMNRGHQAVANG